VAALAAGGGDAVREAALLESWKAYKRGFQQGVALFNAKPKKGVAFLQARAAVGGRGAAAAVARCRTVVACRGARCRAVIASHVMPLKRRRALPVDRAKAPCLCPPGRVPEAGPETVARGDPLSALL